MGRYAIRGLVLLVGILAGLCAQIAGAQTNPCTFGRVPTPFPTLAEEIRDLNAGQQVLGFVVGDLQLEGEVHNRVAVRARILRSLQKCFFENESDLLTFGADVGVRGYFQDNGFFEAKVDVEAKLLDIRNKLQRILIVAHVQEGDQFRLGQLDLIPSDPAIHKLNLRESYLRSLVHLRAGDIISADEIRNGIQRITDIYGKFGFIDATVEPNFDINHPTKTVAITLKVTEEHPYFINSVEVYGLTKEQEEFQKKLVIPGDLYNQYLIDLVILKARPNIPFGSRPPEILQIIRDREKGQVIVILDFRNPSTRTN
jgi:hypothetical protein